MALNVHNAVLRMAEGSCDLLMVYHRPAQPIQLDADRYEMVSLGEETLAPYVKPDGSGAPLYVLPGRASHPLHYLGYASCTYLGQMVDLILKEAPPPCAWTAFTRPTWPRASRPWRWRRAASSAPCPPPQKGCR